MKKILIVLISIGLVMLSVSGIMAQGYTDCSDYRSGVCERRENCPGYREGDCVCVNEDGSIICQKQNRQFRNKGKRCFENGKGINCCSK